MSLHRLPAFEHLEWRPAPRRLRQFALSMVIGFGLLGLLIAWRQHEFGTATRVLWGSGLLLAAGALVPGLGGRIYLAVMVPVALVGYVVSQLVLTAVYLLVFTPIGLALRLAGKDPLRLRPPRGASLWTRRPSDRRRESYYRQF